MVIIKIQEILRRLEYNCDIPYIGNREDSVSAYIYTTYPGDYFVTINYDLFGQMLIEFTFSSEDDRLMFALQHGL